MKIKWFYFSHQFLFLKYHWNIFFKPTLGDSLCTYDSNKKIIETINNIEKCIENFLKSFIET